MTAKTKTETMFALVDQWRASAVTKKVFCEGQGINIHTFSYWVAKHKQAGSNSEPVGGFVGVDVSEPVGLTAVRITYPNGVVVSCPAEPALIGQLIHLA
jgi:hypothetical protein